VTDFEIVGNYPAVYFPGLDLIAVADLHLGLEASMTSRGNYIPEFQLEQILDELEQIKEETGCSRILVNGDLKNQYSTSYSEKKEIDELLGFLTDNFEDVIIIQGNHDTFTESLLEEHGLRPLDSYETKGVLFTHGHETPDKEWKTIVIGHEHPALALDDQIGVTEKVDCLLHFEGEKEVFVLPAYSPISNGSEINRMNSSELLSPILKQFNLDEFQAYAISREAGVFDFGTIQALNKAME